MLYFSKMHGLGNDFIVINGFEQKLPQNLSNWAVKLCDRHFGIGADGIISCEPSDDGVDFKMRIINSDGSEAEMCGNGIRCVALFAWQEGIVDHPCMQISTLAGIKGPELKLINDKPIAVSVDMGEPKLMGKDIPCTIEKDQIIAEPIKILGTEYLFTAVNVGNPHCVIFVDDVANFPVKKIGSLIEKHDLFPEKTNVEFVEVLSKDRVKMRVWERGCGETLACGTGACATAIAAILNKHTGNHVKVELAMGSLTIDWLDDNHIWMTGPANRVFDGNFLEEDYIK